MIIVGITGTIGAGKGAVVDHLKTKYNFKHFSARDFITREVEKRNLPIDRDSMTRVSNELRAEHSPSYIIEKLYQEAALQKQNAIIESIRTLGEVEFLEKQPSFYLIAVDAPQKLRYERIKSRKSSTDFISFEKFTEDEEREMQSDDPTKQNIAACIKVADFSIINDASFDSLHTQIDDVIHTLI